jgi:hypothetical protein
MMKLNKRFLWSGLAFLLALVLIGSYQSWGRNGTTFLSLLRLIQSSKASASSQSSSSSSFLDTTGQQGDSASASNLTMNKNSTTGNSRLSSLDFPIRAAFYYPWFPEGWTQEGIYPYTNYNPSLGFYDLSDQAIIQAHIKAMIYGNIEAGIASWWGQGSSTDQRIPSLLSAAAGTNFKWTIYYEPEGIANPDIATLTSDLTYIRDHYSNDQGFLHIDNRFVVFVYADASDGCEMAERWKQANTVNAYIVLKVFPGYRNCSSQPDGWHQYSPANAEDSQGQYSFTISPGFWKVGQDPQLVRNLQAWQYSVQDMVASGANFQLITSFNEWGEGTAVESANEWSSPSGYGSYLDALHGNAIAYHRYLPSVQVQGTNDPVLLAAGDIASCNSKGDEATAALLGSLPGTIIPLGDTTYESGTIDEFNNCYAHTWGRYKAATFPTPGNHEYRTLGAVGYFSYFGSAAGDPQKGYYSYDIGAWHIIVINANCSEVGGCNQNSPQLNWLQADLAAHPSLCTLAYWHQPRFSSGEHGNYSQLGPVWQVLYQAGVELVLNGHDHDYERFAPQTPDGVADPSHGIREFVVGTGGKNLRPMGSPIANSEIQNDNTWGVLKLTLHAASYEWKFIPVAGKTFTDSGSDVCH